MINRGLTQLHRGDLAAADADLTDARAMLPPDATLQHTLVELNTASLEAVRGRFERCLEHTDRALELLGDQPLRVVIAAIRLWRSVAALGLGDPAAAREELARVSALDADLPGQIAKPLALVERRLDGADEDDIDHSIPVVELVERALEHVGGGVPQT